MDLLFNFIVFAQLVMIAFSAYWFFKRNDELPIIVSGVTFIFSSYRFYSVSQGMGEWIETTVTFGLDYITDDDAFQALIYIALGEFTLLLTYFAMMREKLPIHVTDLKEKKLFPAPAAFIAIGFGVYLMAEQFRALNEDVIQNSYFFLFPLTLIGMSILLGTGWVFGGLPSRAHKIACLAFFACAVYATFGVVLRFQCFGLLVALTTTFTSFMDPRKRMVALAGTMVFGAFLFGASGALRASDNSLDKVAGISNTRGAFDRLIAAEDANMLDGFVILQQVYPNMLNYSWGGEHLEILTRPIPRSIWPDKPVGGFVNKLGLRDTEKDGNLGISPSIYGSFYGEGGVLGIFIFAVIYAAALAKLTTNLTRSHPVLYLMVRATLISWMFPLLRGGDVPGLYSWLGMSVLPILVFCFFKRQYLFKTFQKRARNQSAADALPVNVVATSPDGTPSMPLLP